MSLSTNYPTIRPSLVLDFAAAGRLDPRITFVRNTTARYYDGSTTALAEQNLILWSQEFQQSSWTASTLGTTVTTDTAVAPDGTTTADTLSFVASAYRYNSYTAGPLTGRTFTFSCWVWTATAKSSIGIRISGNTTGSDNTVLAQALTGTATRVSVTRTFTSADTILICGFDNRVPQGGDGIAGDVIVWGAQLEERSTATAYNLTTTQTITNYIPVLVTAPANTARFDYNPTTGAALGLMVEETRTNLNTYSADYSNASYTKGDITITPNTIVAPDGTITGSKFIPNTLNTAKTLSKVYTITAATAVTYSIYIKAGEYNNCVLAFDGLSTGRYGALFDLSNQTATTSVSLNTAGTASGFQSITAVGNGWFRCVVGFTDTTLNDGVISAFVRYTAGSATYNAVTGNDFSGFFIWGSQLEAGTTVSSYIPTVASTVPRNQDETTLTGTNFSSWFNASEYTVVTESTMPLGVGTFPRVCTINNGANNNEVMRQSANGDTLFESNFITYASVQQVNFFIAIARNTPYVRAFAARFNDFAYCRNDLTATQTSASGNMALGLNRLGIGWDSVNGFSSQIYIKRLLFYPARLSNTQVFNLTR